MIAIFHIVENTRKASFLAMHGEKITSSVYAINIDDRRLNELIYILKSRKVHGTIVKFTKTFINATNEAF